jgi:OFA family oxalate/formate antiporter-like MFS transporter
MKESKQGLFSLIASIAIQLTLGIAYLWTLFQSGISDSIFGKNDANAALTFSFLLATLTVGSVFGGKIAAKWNIRIAVLLGTLILSLGFLLASFVTAKAPWLLWLTYGVMGGTGMGFMYSTTIACAQKWYPHKKGLVTGIIVAALGFGGVIFTPVIGGIDPIIKGMINNYGEFVTFRILALVFFVVCGGSAFLLKNPPAVAGAAPLTGLSAMEMLKKPQFYLITGAFLLACMGGLMVIAFATPIARIQGLWNPPVAAMIIAAFNSLGRFVWGMVSDKLGRVKTILILLGGTVVLSVIVGFVNGIIVYFLFAAFGFIYGGFLSSFPSLTADTFGPKNAAVNYGFVLLGFGIGAILSSQIAGIFAKSARAANDTSLMLPAFIIAAGCAVIGIALMVVFNLLQKKEKAKD